MTDKISQRPVPPLDPPERFAGGEVVAAVRCPVDVSTYPRRHVIVVKHAGERQTFSVHEVAHNHVELVGGQGYYDLGYAAAIRLMAEKVAGRARQPAAHAVHPSRYSSGNGHDPPGAARIFRVTPAERSLVHRWIEAERHWIVVSPG